MVTYGRCGQRPVVVITSRYSPHKLALLTFATVAGAGWTFGAPNPTSLVAAMPQPVLKVWAVMLLVHGLAGWAAAVAPKGMLERAMLLELGAMLEGVAALGFAATTAFVYAGWAALLGGGLAATWAVANLLRAVRVARDLRKLRASE